MKKTIGVVCISLFVFLGGAANAADHSIAVLHKDSGDPVVGATYDYGKDYKDYQNPKTTGFPGFPLPFFGVEAPF